MNGGKKFLRAIGITALILFGVGAPLLFGFIIASLGALPLYVTRAYPVVAIGLLAALILTGTGYLKQPWTKRVWLGFLVLCVGCCGYMGWGAYHASIPTVDDRSLLLYEYEPFSEDNKLALFIF